MVILSSTIFTQVEQLKVSHSKDILILQQQHIRLGLRVLPVTNTLPYFSEEIILKNDSIGLGQCYKNFYGRNLRMFVLSQSVVHGKPLQPCVMFVKKARAYSREAPFRCSTLGQAHGLIRQGSKGLPRTNTLTYYNHS